MILRVGRSAVLWAVMAAAAATSCSGSQVKEGTNPDQGPIFYPPPPQEPRVQFLATYNSEKDVTGGASAFQRLILGDEKYRELGKPYGATIHDGKLLICDTRFGVVWDFDIRNKSVSILGAGSSVQLKKPINIVIDEDGTHYVTDVGANRVIVFDKEGRYVKALGDAQKWTPTDVAIFHDKLYVTDVKAGQIAVLDKKTGAEQRRIGTRGSGEGQMFFPTNIEVDAHGNVYVSDTGNFRVLKFNAHGKQALQYGSMGRSPGQFARPKGVAIDRSDRLYVVDTAFENVQIFDNEGKLLLFFGVAGNVPGGINIPAQVEIDYDNTDLFADRVAPGYSLEYLIIVTSQFGINKVNIYGFLKPKKGETGSVDPS